MSRRGSLVKTLSSVFLGEEKKEDEDDNVDGEPTFLASDLGPQVAAILDKYGDKIHDDSFLKIIRQLEFWYTTDLSDDEFLALTERLAKVASWRDEVDDESLPDDKKFKIPTVRFGKTEIDMPIVTCGGELCCNVICVHILCIFYIMCAYVMHIIISQPIDDIFHIKVCAFKKLGFQIQCLFSNQTKARW